MQIETQQRKVTFWTSCRFRLAFLMFLGYAILYALRTNLSVAIVDMVELASTNNFNASLVSCAVSSELVTLSDSQAGTRFKWTSSEQGYILGAWFYGFVTSQIGGGILADRFSPTFLFATGVGLTTSLSLLTPMSTKLAIGSYSFGGLFALRFLQGITNGIAHPCASALWSRWAPPAERGRLASFSLSGIYIGIILVQPITGLVTRYYSWEASFYVVGIGSLFWLPIWIWFASDDPESHRSISQCELTYLQQTTTDKKTVQSATPWLNILFSIPIWGNLFAFFSHDFLTYTFLTSLPKYLNNVHHFNVSTSGIISSLPYICNWICIILQAQLAIVLQRRNVLSPTGVRRSFHVVAGVIPSICLGLITAAGCDTSRVMAYISISVCFTGFAYSTIFNPNVLDLAPNYSGVLFGIANTVANLTGFIAPQMAGYSIDGNEFTVSGWANVWTNTLLIYITGAAIYCLTATANKQPWNDEPMPLLTQFKFEKDQLLFNCTQKYYKVSQPPLIDSKEEFSTLSC